jgi:hypothetical protein
MIAEPRLVRQLGYLRPSDFGDDWHRAVYSAVLATSRNHPPVPDGWREAIVRASGPAAVTMQELDALVRECPDPRHGAAYGTMVIQSGAVEILREQAKELAARARQVTNATGDPSHGLSAQGVEGGIAARHLAKVGAAIAKHADFLGPRTVHAAVQGGPLVEAEQVRREELVLASLLKPGHTWVRETIACIAEAAFRDPYRRAVFSVLTSMHRDRRPVDPLTVDWELASSGLPIYQGIEAAANGLSEETYSTRLARTDVAQGQAVKAARELQQQQGHAVGLEAALHDRRSTPGSRGRGTSRQTPPPSAEQTLPRLGLVQRPPGRSAEGPGRGPHQARWAGVPWKWPGQLRQATVPELAQKPSADPRRPVRRGSARGYREATPLEIGHDQMNDALRAGIGVPLGQGLPWVTRFFDAWWVEYEGGWLRVVDDQVTAELDDVAARLAAATTIASGDVPVPGVGTSDFDSHSGS